MSSLLVEENEELEQPGIGRQAFRFIVHTLLAVGFWFVLMLLGYLLNPRGVSQNLILAGSFVFPMVLGHLVNRVSQDESAGYVWLMGVTWFLIVALYVIDMPTGPNACLQCGVTDKITRTFFSFPTPGGLIDNDGPFLATWPVAALFGYSIGAWLAPRKRAEASE